MKFYGLKTCDTCRKAQKELCVSNIEFTVIDVRADGVSTDKLKEWTAKADWKKLLNTRSTTWRNLGAAKKTDMDEAKAIALMTENPTLIKRPVIEKNTKIFIGWSAETKAAVL